MATERARPRAPPGYARHRPEETLLHRIVARHYPELVAVREAAGRPLPTRPIGSLWMYRPVAAS
jgi:hypothetical protein